MSEHTISIKCTMNGDTRRRAVPTPVAFDALRAVVAELFASNGVADVALKYVDDDGDTITIGSQIELEEALACFDADNGGIVRLLVEPKTRVAEFRSSAEAAVDAFDAQFESFVQVKADDQSNNTNNNIDDDDDDDVENAIANAMLAALPDVPDDVDSAASWSDADSDDDDAARASGADKVAASREVHDFFAGLGLHVVKASERLGEQTAAAGERLRAAVQRSSAHVRKALDELLDSGVVARDQLQEVLSAIRASPELVQRLVGDLAKLAREQRAALAAAGDAAGVAHAARCDACAQRIVGVRYKCVQCADYDLCARCEARSNADAASGVHDATHVFLKLRHAVAASQFSALAMRRLVDAGCAMGEVRPPARADGSPRPADVISLTPALAAAFVANVSIPDGSVLAADEAFVKMWKVTNDGAHAWPAGVTARFVGGDELAVGDNCSERLPAVAPGESVIVVVDMLAPSVAGHFTSFWRLQTPFGARFGQRLWADIVVEEEKKADNKEEEEEEEEELNEEDGNEEAVVDGEAKDEDDRVGVAISDSVMQQIERSFEKMDDVEESQEESEHEASEEEEDIEVIDDDEVINNDDEVINNDDEVINNDNDALFQSQLTQLKNMGFGDESANERLLKQHNGDVLSVVQDLLADD